MEVLRRTKSVLRAFLGGLTIGVFVMYGGLVADKAGYIDLAIEFAYGAYNVITPDGDGTVAATQDASCSGGFNSDCIDGDTSSSSAPSAGGFLTFANNQQDYYTMTSLTGVSSVTQVDVEVHHQDGANMAVFVSLWDETTESVQYGTEVQLTQRGTGQWDGASFSTTNFPLSQGTLNGLDVRLRCARPGGGKSNGCTVTAMFAAVNYTESIDVTVSTTSTQQDLDRGTTTAHVGGTFSIVENTSSRNITDITITENGSVDALVDLDNIELFYKIDNSSPYDCVDYPYSATSTQFGTTDTSGFSAANGTSTFSTSTGVQISTTATLCIYPVLDVLTSAGIGDVIEIEISDPSTEVVGTGAPAVEPSTAIALGGLTTILDEDIQVTDFHWRNDDNNDETDSTSATAGVDNTHITDGMKSTNYRLRYAVSNEGNKTDVAKQYRLEFGTKDTTCGAIGTWTDVNSATDDWDMTGSGSKLIEGNDTTDIAEGIGGITPNPNSSFLTTNGGQRETTSQTGSLSMTSSNFVEIEYAIIAAGSVSDGTTYCFRLSDAGSVTEVNNTTYPEFTVAADITVAANGSQASTISIPSIFVDNGGQFAVTDGTSATVHDIQSFTITASGTVDWDNDISDLALYYDLDQSAPQNCSGESFNGNETQYGATSTGGFSAAATSTFTGSVTASTTQAVCFYVVYDVDAEATDGETLEVRIADPSMDIIVDMGSVSPVGLLDITGFTTLTAADVQQGNYHWRNNDNTGETDSTSATAGVENTIFDDVSKNTTIRVRFDVSNTGGEASGNYQYRLEWAQKISSCAAVAEIGWEDVDTAADQFTMVASLLVDNADTTNIATSIGGVTNLASTFDGTNGGQKDGTSQTNNLDLATDNYAELEYSIQATSVASEGASYCFRVSNAGTALDNYTNYPELNVKLGTDFAITRGFSTIPNASSTAYLTNTSEYNLQINDATRAFIRITNTGHTGAGPGSTGNHNAADVTAYISNPSNIVSGITFTRSGTTGDTRIAWEVVEYIGATGGENEIVVRSASTIAYTTTETATTTGTVSGIVTDADVVPWITGQGSPDGGRFDYNAGLSTSAWNAGTDSVTFTRGENGSDAVTTSYAVIEFTGANWIIQRSSKTYSLAAGTLESDATISPVGSILQTFLHTQKRVGADEDQHADFGHEVYMNSIGDVKYLLDGNAQTPSLHTSVAWIIENTQSTGNIMHVERSNGTVSSGGGAPTITNVPIGKTLSDLTIASILTNNRADGTGRTFQEPIISARLLTASTTEYELWVGDNSDNINYRTEIVEWPTANAKLSQNYFQLYEDNDLITPVTVWAGLAENAEMTGSDSPIASGESIRIRMSLNVSAATHVAGVDAFLLEFAERPDGVTCTSLSESVWFRIGDIGSTTAIWRGHAGTPVDGTTLPSTLMSVSDITATYEEENNTALTPVTAAVGDDIEFDWSIEDNGASDKTDYCFRMKYSDGAPLESISNYPLIRTVGYGPIIWDWKWFDDETSLTPSIQLAATNTAPSSVANDNLIKLRTVISEVSGAAGVDTKFKLQFSEFSDFSQGVFDVVSSSTCFLNATTTSALWCYADGSGVDNATVDDNTLSTADSCSAGSGNGCGTHNEGTASTTATLDQPALSNMEFEFTIENQGARASAVYYFRLYDVQNEEIVVASSTYPSLVAEGSSLVFTISGVTSGTDTEGVTTDVTTTPSIINFGSIPFDTEYAAAQTISVNTNATQGYQIIKYARQTLLNTYAEAIPAVTGTNAVPSGWTTGCTVSAIGCFGYHAGDDTLDGGSVRFAAHDSYAAFDTTPQEIMYSSVPANESSDIVYKIQITNQQPAGDYQTEIVYIAIPVF